MVALGQSAYSNLIFPKFHMCPKEGSDIGASKLIPSLFLPFLAQRPQLKNEQGISNLPGEGGGKGGV